MFDTIYIVTIVINLIHLDNYGLKKQYKGIY